MRSKARVLCPIGSPNALRRGAPPLMAGDIVDVDWEKEGPDTLFISKDGVHYGFLSGRESERLMEVLETPEWSPK